MVVSTKTFLGYYKARPSSTNQSWWPNEHDHHHPATSVVEARGPCCIPSMIRDERIVPWTTTRRRTSLSSHCHPERSRGASPNTCGAWNRCETFPPRSARFVEENQCRQDLPDGRHWDATIHGILLRGTHPGRPPRIVPGLDCKGRPTMPSDR